MLCSSSVAASAQGRASHLVVLAFAVVAATSACGQSGPDSEQTGGVGTGGVGAGVGTGGVGAGVGTGGVGTGGVGAGLGTGGVGAGLGTGGLGLGGVSSGGTSAAGNCVAPVTGADLHPGNYDYETCEWCHTGTNAYWGGWLYNNQQGDAWIGGATVTITNSDGTTVSSPTADDGFFTFSGGIGASFTPCVSKCPDTLCANETHTSSHCQDAACHGGLGRSIHLPQSQVQGTGGGGGTNCTPPASFGARVHAARDLDYSYQGCRICHDERYTGGWVYDGLTSSNTVSMVTITITPTDGSPPITTVSGPGGMFFLGQVGSPSTFAPLPAPYTVCVSKCPTTVCSLPGTHPTADNCGDCHNETLRIYLP